MQGISGILADEMGLGKTVQSIAFLCHVAEKYCKHVQRKNYYLLQFQKLYLFEAFMKNNLAVDAFN